MVAGRREIRNMNLETFICSTALPVLDSESHYPGWFDTVSDSYLYPLGEVWMRGIFHIYLAVPSYVARCKFLHGGSELIVNI